MKTGARYVPAMTSYFTRILLMAGASALAAPLCAQEAPPLAERTAQSDLPLEGPRAAMELAEVSLSITVDPAGRSITGDGHYRVLATDALTQLQFDLDPRFRISKVQVDGVQIDRAAFANPDGLLTIDLPSALPAGASADVQIGWDGQPHVAIRSPWDGGFTWSQTPDGQPWIATAVQGEGCDMFWPCLDHSSKRIGTIDMRVTVPDPLVVAGNGKLVATYDAGDSTVWHWRARDPSNYGVTLQIGPYELAENTYRSRYGNTIPLKFWHLPGHEQEAARLLSELASYLDFFESVIGPYPFSDEKVGIAETPHLGMEHQTINAYGNAFRRDPLGYDGLLQHEFSHEWFANQLRQTNLRHMWLQEGTGTWMQPLYLGWLNGEMYYAAKMWDHRKRIVSRVPMVPLHGDLPDYNDREAGWGRDIYDKGAWILHTLRYLVGEEALFTSLRRLTYGTDNPQPGAIRPVSRTTDDFRLILEDVSGTELSWFFDAYFHQADLPRLRTTRGETALSLEWLTPSDLPFTMPVTVLVDGKQQVVNMPGGRGSLPLPGDQAHVVVDPQNQILMYDADIAAWQAQQEDSKN